MYNCLETNKSLGFNNSLRVKKMYALKKLTIEHYTIPFFHS